MSLPDSVLVTKQVPCFLIRLYLSNSYTLTHETGQSLLARPQVVSYTPARVSLTSISKHKQPHTCNFSLSNSISNFLPIAPPALQACKPPQSAPSCKQATLHNHPNLNASPNGRGGREASQSSSTPRPPRSWAGAGQYGCLRCLLYS